MTITKYLVAMLVVAIRKELTIQKPAYVASRQKKPANRGDAAKGILILIIAPVIFFILAAMVL